MTLLPSAHLISRVLERFLHSLSTCRHPPPPPNWDRSVGICSVCIIMYIMVRKKLSHIDHPREAAASTCLALFCRLLERILSPDSSAEQWWLQDCSRMGGGNELAKVGLETTNNRRINEVALNYCYTGDYTTRG